MAIYTKKGDFGKTFLYSGKKTAKSNWRIEAIGNIDELNCLIGFVLSQSKQKDKIRFLKTVQQDLLSINSDLAGFTKTKLNLKLKAGKMERIIDTLEEKLPKLSNFIIPGGCYLATLLHLTRAVTRRTERSVVRFY